MQKRLYGFGASVALHAILAIALFYLSRVDQPPPETAWIEWGDTSSAPRSSKQAQLSVNAPDQDRKNTVSQERQRQNQAPVKPLPSNETGNLPYFGLNSIEALRQRSLSKNEGSQTGTDDPSAQPGSQTEGADPMQSLEAEAHGWSKGVQYGKAMDLKFVNENLSFFDALHRKINAALVYPEDFARARYRGKIQIQATVAKDGRLIDFVASKADNDVLHAYSLTFLIHLLRHPLPERYWLNAEQAVVVFDFDYRIRIEGSNPTTLESGVQKNRLAFGREAIVDPILNEKIHEIFTHYVPPIVPLPGGFYVDLVLAYQYVKNLVEGAPVESQAREARIKQLHKELLATIRAPRATPSTSPVN